MQIFCTLKIRSVVISTVTQHTICGIFLKTRCVLRCFISIWSIYLFFTFFLFFNPFFLLTAYGLEAIVQKVKMADILAFRCCSTGCIWATDRGKHDSVIWDSQTATSLITELKPWTINFNNRRSINQCYLTCSI